MTDDGWIPSDTWTDIIRYVPIVSVDLIILVNSGMILGKRANEPAKGE